MTLPTQTDTPRAKAVCAVAHAINELLPAYVLHKAAEGHLWAGEHIADEVIAELQAMGWHVS